MADDALDALLERIRRLEDTRERTRTMIVDSVQEGGSVNLRESDDEADPDDESGGIIPGVPSLMSADVQTGQVVLVREARGQHVVIGATGDFSLPAHTHPHPTEPVSAITVSDTAAPAGQRWKEVSTLWERQGGDGTTELWGQRVTAGSGGSPTVTSGTVTKTTQRTASWRPDAGWGGGKPAQGRYRGSGYGSYTGLWMYGAGTWSALAGKTITGVRVSAARTSGNHGNYGGVPVYLHTHNHQDVPGSPSLALGPFSPGTLALGQRDEFTLPVSVGEYLRDNPGAGIACRSPNPDAYLIYKTSLTVHVDWED